MPESGHPLPLSSIIIQRAVPRSGSSDGISLFCFCFFSLCPPPPSRRPPPPPPPPPVGFADCSAFFSVLTPVPFPSFAASFLSPFPVVTQNRGRIAKALVPPLPSAARASFSWREDLSPLFPRGLSSGHIIVFFAAVLAGTFRRRRWPSGERKRKGACARRKLGKPIY